MESNNGYEVYVWNERDPREQLKFFLGLPQITIPGILVESDYGGYFEALVRGWCATKSTPFKHKKIIITAGPYRQLAVTAAPQSDGETLHLDFYSAIRNGFGNISEKEIQEIKDNWL